MCELPGKIRVQDAALANMVTIAAMLDYLDKTDPGSKAWIENRASEIARGIRESEEAEASPEVEPEQN